MFKFFLFKACYYFANVLPLKVSYAIANVISDFLYLSCFRDRQSVINNLKIILAPNQDWPKLTREVFHNFGIYLLEFFRMKKTLTDDYLKNNIRIENIEFLQETYKYGKGTIVLTAHMGNWELGGSVVTKLGFPLMIIALPHAYKPINDFFNQQREAFGSKIVPTNIMVRRCIEHLQDNQFVAIASDRGFGSSGQMVDFMGHKAILPKGAASFSEKTGAPIVPIFLVRDGCNRFILKIKKPIYPPQGNTSLTKDEIILKIMNQYVPALEEIIRQYPTQWTVFREFAVK